ncbi:MAG: SpoIIE family protein phosphatase [Bacteroidales bacterium]|nr:SpoIIE family protein phosphatase [Bacteroidales bacterium]MBN2755600.1 SpoIIE family protein phosphatase [Bacteroidales bacterium]
MFSTLKSQLYTITLSFTIVSMLLLFIAFIHNRKIEEQILANLKLKQTEYLIAKGNNYINLFMLYESIDSNFYKKKESKYYDKFMLNEKEIKTELLNYNELNTKNKDEIRNLKYKIDSISKYFKTLISLQLKRGFKDYGIVGSMRDNIHWIENEKALNKSDILMLRRHEKDYIIRQQKKYIVEHNLLINKLLQRTNSKNTIFHLKSYSEKLNNVVSLDNQIGRMGDSGKTKELNLEMSSISKLISIIVHNNTKYKNTLLKIYKFGYFGFAATFFILSILASVYISSRMSRQFHFLSKTIRKFIKSDFKIKVDLPYKEDKNEIHNLTRDFIILSKEISDYINYFQEKVDEQTQKLTNQKKLIEEKNIEITSQKEKLQDQYKIILKQTSKVEEQNKKFLDSVYYALQIQNALLPNTHALDQMFSNNFIFYKPKDILSGDFYWARTIKINEIEYKIAVVADCTGHGVPGALLSMLGILFLDEVIVNNKIISPAKILDFMRYKIILTFQQKENFAKISDGIDMAICVFNEKENNLKFAGANRDLYLFRDDKLNRFKGDNMPLGKFIKTDKFNEFEISLNDDDLIYMMSDGYSDQFGGKNHLKYKVSNLRILLSEVAKMPIKIQKDALSLNFDNWKGNCEQIDDVLIMGIKYNHKRIKETVSTNKSKKNQITK